MTMLNAIRGLLRSRQVLSAAMALAVVVAVPQTAVSGPAAFMPMIKKAAAPQGFKGICSRYSWVCARQKSRVSEGQKLELASAINLKVNRAVMPVSDRSNFGVEEYWTLPANGRGDCEDYALLKMRLLLEAGIGSEDLFLATVLTPRREHHVVLMVRAAGGDIMLDSLTNSIRPWDGSGYTILKGQNPTRRDSWQLILHGPMARMS